jgi:hypothetical protein
MSDHPFCSPFCSPFCDTDLCITLHPLLLQVTPESLRLHYYSSRPGLWPVVVGVLKGIAREYFQLDLQVELAHSRDKGDCDHEVGGAHKTREVTRGVY